MSLRGCNEPALFYHSIQAILKSWTALQLAVSHSFSGPHSKEKAQWLVGVIETFFKENKNVQPYDLEEFLEEIMTSEFDLMLEDGSVKEISLDIWKIYKLWIEGNYDSIRERLSGLPCINLGDSLSANPVVDSTMEDIAEQDKLLNQLSFCKPNTERSEQENQPEKGSNSQNNGDEDDGWIQVVTRKKRQK